MSLPRPINWLRDGSSEDAQKVLDAAQDVKAALEEAQAKLETMEQENNEEASRLQEALQENLNEVINNMGGVPRNQFIVTTSFPFIPEDSEAIPDEVKTLSLSATPFPTPEMAAFFARNIVGVVSSMMAMDLIPTLDIENVEETPGDVIFHTKFKTEDGADAGALYCKFWQYRPNQERPDDIEGTGDWI